MSEHNALIPREELIQRLCIKMAASNRNPPILRGKAAPRDNREKDAFLIRRLRRIDCRRQLLQRLLYRNGARFQRTRSHARK